MKIIKIDLPSDARVATILPLADLHLGDAHCNIEEIQKNIDYIKNNENVYTILNGDLINNATKNSVSDVYSETLTPMQQLKRARELLEPIKDRILCITNGNHESRSWRMDGIDLMEILSRELGMADRYAPNSAMLFVKLGTNVARLSDARGHKFLYTIYVKHGSGGGKKVGGKANNLEAMSDVVDADIYIMSHVHLPAVFKESYFRTDLRHQTVIPVDKLFVNTNAYLNYGGYGETFGFTPASIKAPKIYISGVKKDFTAEL